MLANTSLIYTAYTHLKNKNTYFGCRDVCVLSNIMGLDDTSAWCSQHQNIFEKTKT